MTMRLVNADGRAALLSDHGIVDIERHSGGRFDPDPMAVIARWDEVREWADTHEADDFDVHITDVRLGPPVPRPRSVFGIGLNYRSHAEEAGMDLPTDPLVFAKFPNCIAGPEDAVLLSSETVDWEVELVVVVGHEGRSISPQHAFDHVAGYTLGQDISDRMLQFRGRPPQFSLGKSFDTYGPIGPAIVSLDTFDDPDNVGLSCEISGERMQDCRTDDMVFPVSELVAYVSSVCSLAPGDLIFTGTPSGVGSVRTPPRFLRDGDVVRSHGERIGTMTNRCTGPTR